MRLILSLSILIFSSFTFLKTEVLAQSSQLSIPLSDIEAVAVYADRAPRIDGDLSDEIWASIAPITNFTQVWPNDGAPATEDSEVRIAYDEDNLYFAFRFYDKNPELILARNLERGGRNSRDDHVYIGLDTYLDGRNAYLFEMNALGTQDDALINDESLDYGSFSWEAVFKSETQIDDEGWTLEVAIPFRQLRFPDGDELEFGLMLSRTIIRKNERVIWPAIGFDYGGYDGVRAAVSQYGVLKGIRNIKRGNHIELKPYVISGAQEVRSDLQFQETMVDYTYDIGGDLKWGISSNLTLDLTVNTDFAQVESDDVQLNLSRFSLFFPEKREFFLERAGLFEHGNTRSTQTFFSRQIGLNNQILAGARFTGQAGRLSYGGMNIETGNQLGQILGNQSSNNSVLRMRANILPRASVGAIATNVEDPIGYNRALGLDANFRFWKSSEFKAWFTNVWDSNQLLNDAAGNVSLRLENETYEAGVSYTNVGENYNPQLGFVRRKDLRQYNSNLGYNPIVKVNAVPDLARLNFSGSIDYIEGQDGIKQSSTLSGLAGLQFTSSKALKFSVNQQFERLDFPFEIRNNAFIQAGDYTFNTYSINAETNDSKRFYASGGLSVGDFYSGTRSSMNVRVGFRQSNHINLDGRINRSVIDLPIPNGNFEATTFSTTIFGAVNRDLFARTLIQYDNFSRDIQVNFRINWIHTPGSNLFLVYNTSYHITGDNETLFDPRRNLIMNSEVGIVKLTYLIML